MKLARAVLIAGLVGLLGACGGPSGEPGQPATSLTPATPIAPAPASSTGPGSPASPAGGPVTVSGTVEAGVEPGCLLLNGYLLVGGDRDTLRSGARVTVTGRAQPDLMSTCQQGTPLRVQTVRPG